jgi:hypothetical protein
VFETLMAFMYTDSLPDRGGPGPVRAVRAHRAQKIEGPKNFYISIGSLVYYVQTQPNNEHKSTTGNRIMERTTNRINRRQPPSLVVSFVSLASLCRFA